MHSTIFTVPTDPKQHSKLAKEMMAARDSMFAVPVIGPAIPLRNISAESAFDIITVNIATTHHDMASFSLVVWPIIKTEGVQ